MSGHKGSLFHWVAWPKSKTVRFPVPQFLLCIRGITAEAFQGNVEDQMDHLNSTGCMLALITCVPQYLRNP